MEHDGLEIILRQLQSDTDEKVRLLNAAHEDGLKKTMDGLEEAHRQELEALKGQGVRESEKLIEKAMAEGKADSDKVILTQKNLLLDKVFQLAMDRLCQLDDEALEAFMSRLMARVDEITDGVPYTVEHPQNVEGGFIVHTEGYDLDCTYRKLLEQVREVSDVELARLLFE